MDQTGKSGSLKVTVRTTQAHWTIGVRSKLCRVEIRGEREDGEFLFEQKMSPVAATALAEMLMGAAQKASGSI